MAPGVQRSAPMLSRPRSVRPLVAALLLSVASASVPAARAATGPATDRIPFELPLAWPEEQRAFLQDGPGLLLSDAEIEDLANRDREGRRAFIDTFFSDPIPETPENELRDGVERRRALALSEIGTLLDERARILFLRGAPLEREIVDCAETFRPLEIWTYPGASGQADGVRLLLFQPQRELPWRLWLPIDGKGVLYNEEMEYWLQQWEELGNLVRGRRFDRQICDDSEEIDDVSGIEGLFGFRKDRPKNELFQAFLDRPSDLATWARTAAATPLPTVDDLPIESVQLHFPDRDSQRMVSRVTVVVPGDAGLVPFVEGESRELRLRVEGRLEHRGRLFDEFRVRFQIPPAAEDVEVPVALVVDRALRPERDFLLRLNVVEETTDRRANLSRSVLVPRHPTPPDELPAVPEEAIVALGEELRQRRVEGYDSLLLVPPEADVVFGLWRAEALVTGTAITRVTFYLDDEKVMSRRRPPFTAELRLEPFPREQVIRVEGTDDDGNVIASDEVILNQPRGELRVRILEPPRGDVGGGTVTASAEVVVPEEKKVRHVEFRVNDELQTTLERPPWQAQIDVPYGGELTYLTVVAELDDGQRAEDVRFLASPDHVEEVDVNLIELYTTVTDRGGRLVPGLAQTDFEVREDGRLQKLVKFELVEDLPLTIGVTLDTSGSMFESLGEAKRTAVEFLESMVTARDRCFALAFADRPALVMGRTSDVGAVAEQIEDLAASGSTALHDAVVTSLYYFRGVRGRRALVLLSDGEDTTSSLEFDEALEYARRSGVAIYSIGLRIGITQVNVRRKLENLAEETGGRTFYIGKAEELRSVYGEIERELRSQYLLAYSPPPGGEEGVFHEIEVEVKRSGAKARTIKGYYE